MRTRDSRFAVTLGRWTLALSLAGALSHSGVVAAGSGEPGQVEAGSQPNPPQTEQKTPPAKEKVDSAAKAPAKKPSRDSAATDAKPRPPGGFRLYVPKK